MNNPDLTKVCSSCGQRKSLSAFLQLAGFGYGSICATCRKTNLQNAPEKEDSTRSTTGEKIDSKAKVQEAFDKREAEKQIKENYAEERNKLEEKQILRSQKIADISDNDKKIRQNFLEKTSFLNAKKPNIAPASTPVVGGEEHKAIMNRVDYTAGPNRVIQTKTQTSVYLTFQKWLGKTDLTKSTEHAAQEIKDQGNKTTEKASTDPSSEFIRRNTGPNRK